MGKVVLKSFLLKGAGVLSLSLYLVGCQTTAPTMTVQEARKLSVDFEVSKFKNLPRTTLALRQEFKQGGPVPKSCVAKREKRNSRLKNLTQRLNSYGVGSNWGALHSLSVAAEGAMVSGRFEEAKGYIQQGISATQYHVKSKATLRSQLARIYAQVGDVGMANFTMLSFSGPKEWIDGSIGQIFFNAGWAAVAQAEGDLALAEYFYRKAIYHGRAMQAGVSGYINLDELRSQLALVLLQQGRLIEAEAQAREAIKKMGIGLAALRAHKKVYQTDYYSGEKAGPVAILATVFMEQGRLDDAAYLAKIAVNMHEIGCSSPVSLGLNRARATLIDVLAQQGKWQEVLDQVNIARTSLIKFPELFAKQFGANLNYAEAEIYVGNAQKGQRVLDGVLDEFIKEQGRGSLDVASIKGVLGLAQLGKGNRDEALKLFSDALPTLIRGVSNEASGAYIYSNARRERIFKGYMAGLQSFVDEGIFQTAGLSIPAELLRVASASRLGRVQQAFSASHVRAASGDVELSKLVRQEQDLAEETRSVSETLVYLRFSPDVKNENISAEKLQTRLQKIRLARKTLNAEISSRFPEYSEFTNPLPMSISEMARVLRPNQALVVYHVMDDKTYIWGLRNKGELLFAVSNLGREVLAQKITGLRNAVDPKSMNTINDVPAYDVVTAHSLYNALLKPVFAITQGADELMVVPDGPLGSLPFSMLTTTSKRLPKKESVLFQGYGELDWLARKVAIVQLPSINTLKSLKKAGSPDIKKTRRAFVGFGDPYFSRSQALSAQKMQVASLRNIGLRSKPNTRSVENADLALLPRLPDTRDEIISIGKALGADLKRDLYMGKNATEENVKNTDLSSYKVISFATHGLVPGDLNGLDLPALALTNPNISGSTGDGLLTTNEILGLNLQADFAVLSACNTAAGDGQGAEAVSGLGRAFFYAGARSLLVSNWPVHSGATTKLMSTLFADLAANPKLTRGEAVRRTRVKMIDEMGYRQSGKMIFSYAHPIFWAPFTIVGDGGN